VRLEHLFWRPQGRSSAEVIEYGGLVSLETYQAAINTGVDLTYMEYELLSSWRRIPARCSHARRCSRGLGYDYFGGARDGHVTSGVSGELGRSTPT